VSLCLSARLKARGCHMLRRARPPSQRGHASAMSLVGLGVFPARGQLGTGMCSDKACPEVATRWAVWLLNGEVVVLGFCDRCTEQHLLADERAYEAGR
jgi:hypothetical protein